MRHHTWQWPHVWTTLASLTRTQKHTQVTLKSFIEDIFNQMTHNTQFLVQSPKRTQHVHLENRKSQEFFQQDN